MKAPNWLLFSITSLIWGTTWYAIKLQLTEVSPLFSIAYRFAIASVILFTFLLITRKRVKYSFADHRWFMLQGVLLFGLCYWFTYLAELQLTSGLVAVLSSLIIFFNVIFGRILLKHKIEPKLLIGFAFGLVGMMMLYKDELGLIEDGMSAIKWLGVAVMANVVASLGNIVSLRNQGEGFGILQLNAFGMAYGSILVFLIGLFKGDPTTFENTSSYILSLIYLSVFGSILAFYGYLTLLGRMGPGKAAYVSLIIPIIALIVSSVFESFQWSLIAVTGLVLVLIGNWLALSKKKIPVGKS